MPQDVILRKLKHKSSVHNEVTYVLAHFFSLFIFCFLRWSFLVGHSWICRTTFLTLSMIIFIIKKKRGNEQEDYYSRSFTCLLEILKQRAKTAAGYTVLTAWISYSGIWTSLLEKFFVYCILIVYIVHIAKKFSWDCILHLRSCVNWVSHSFSNLHDINSRVNKRKIKWFLKFFTKTKWSLKVEAKESYLINVCFSGFHGKVNKNWYITNKHTHHIMKQNSVAIVESR